MQSNAPPFSDSSRLATPFSDPANRPLHCHPHVRSHRKTRSPCRKQRREPYATHPDRNVYNSTENRPFPPVPPPPPHHQNETQTATKHLNRKLHPLRYPESATSNSSEPVQPKAPPTVETRKSSQKIITFNVKRKHIKKIRQILDCITKKKGK